MALQYRRDIPQRKLKINIKKVSTFLDKFRYNQRNQKMLRRFDTQKLKKKEQEKNRERRGAETFQSKDKICSNVVTSQYSQRKF